jgi:phosphate transport system substrate-binding protein
LVFAVAQDAAVSEVTTAQIQGLYSGDVSRWPDNTPARPVLRPASDSDTLLLREAFPELIAAIDAAGTRRGVPTAATDQDAADMLTSIPGAFGTSTLALILAERRPLKPLPLNGIAPTPANLAAGRYPLAKNLYFVVPSSPSSLALRFLNYVRSPAARRTLEQTGHQPIEFPAL